MQRKEEALLYGSGWWGWVGVVGLVWPPGAGGEVKWILTALHAVPPTISRGEI